MMPLVFVVPGKPVPKGRPRASVRAGRVHMRTPPRTVAYEDAVAWAARHAAFGKALDMVEGTGTARPLAVSIVAVLARVGRLDKRGLTAGRVWAHGSTADADNIAKAVLDGMQRGGALANDRHVVDVRCRMVYAAAGEAAHTWVTVREVEGVEVP